MRLHAVLAPSLLAGCGGGSQTTPSASGDGAGQPTACSPLEPTSTAIALEEVIGAGRHADGTIYIIDRGRPEYRAFVSDATGLHRVKVSGSGSGPGRVVATIQDANAPFTLKVETAGETATRMAVYRGELRAKDFEIGTEGDQLELLQLAAYSSLAVHNLPGTVVVEYDASTEDGHRIVVTRPETDWAYEDFRLFYGTPDAMIERPLSNASRGSATYLTFTMDGASYDVFFPSPLSSPDASATLSSNGSKQNLTLRGADASPGVGLTYFCL